MTSNNIIEVENLVKKYGGFAANDNISFTVKKDEIFGFLGPNGAGKTTAIKILAGLSRPTEGKVIVNGLDVYTESEKIKQNIGYMSQKFTLYMDMTVYENIRFYGGIYGLNRSEIDAKANYFLEKLSLQESRNKLVSELPIGWRQKLAFSISIIHEPSIVFLDEPTSGVDPVTRRQFWEMIYETANEGTTVFITTHYMDEAEYCERVTILDEGKVKDIGSPDKLKNKYSSKNMNQVFLEITRNKSN